MRDPRAGGPRVASKITILVVMALLAVGCASSVPSAGPAPPAPSVASPTTAPTPAAAAETLAADPTATPLVAEEAAPQSIDERNAALGRGINLGNALEAPNEGDWGVILEAGYFDTIADAGFDSVRIPVRWSAHAAEEAPYTIDETFFERIDWALDQAQRVGLTAVLNMHHYEELHLNPAAQSQRFLAMWEQIAARYSERPQTLYFELLNEPTDEFTLNPELWNELLADAIDVIRVDNPERAVVVGPVGWNNPAELDSLRLPADRNLIVTVHLYEPFEFTHQGATWINAELPVGVSWSVDSLGPADGWSYASWDLRVNSEGAMIDVRYDQQWAALAFRSEEAFSARAMAIEANGPATLDIICDSAGSFETVDRIEVADGWGIYRADITRCGPDTTDIGLQNVLDNPGPLLLRSIEVCTTTECEQLLGSQLNRLQSSIRAAADWAEANDRPLFVGEFGTYFEADMDSRASWTAEVQQAAIEAGMSTAYWEFAAGYGAYDRDTEQWFKPLLDALMG